MIKPSDFFDLSKVNQPIRGLLDEAEIVWQIIGQLKPYLVAMFPDKADIQGQVDAGATLINPESIYIGPGTRVEAGAYIAGPTYIGANCEVRHGAYVRGSVLTGDNCVLGHASEFKNVVMLSGSQAGHFAYLGDTILGHNVNLGAGTKMANLEVLSNIHKKKTGVRPSIKIRIPGYEQPLDTGLAKMGAILGDEAQTGCNAVTNPGCLIGPETLIYPNTSLAKGYYEGKKIIKLRQTVEVVSLNG
ncbi:MAG: glucose-1-phosphate thymidylyltransferase [Chloroflexota bacterium]